MTKKDLIRNIARKRSFLCVGLDSDPLKLPKCITDTTSSQAEAMLAFNKAIIDATAPYCVAYKPNTAFYEALGAEGWEVLAQTVDYIRRRYPDQFVIADAKRGDIGNTSALYARAFFDNMDVDAITVAPYMGSDSVKPFLGHDGKWVILLALTSNPGSKDFQFTESTDGNRLFERVLTTAREWASDEEMMFVVGATGCHVHRHPPLRTHQLPARARRGCPGRRPRHSVPSRHDRRLRPVGELLARHHLRIA